MGRISTKENKNIYQICREEKGLSREKASELLETMSPERIEKIENEKVVPHPDEVFLMSQKYKMPNLCNHYCSKQCKIGQQYVPEIKVHDLSQIVLKMLSSLNAMNSEKDKLIDICADGVITADEMEQFVSIQAELEKISISVETLQFWAEHMVANGAIDKELYQAYKEGK